MRATRRRLLIAGAAAVACPFRAAASDAALRIILPFSAGSPTDAAVRLMLQPLSAQLQTDAVIENMPGAVATIAALAVIKSPKDGRTIMIGTNTSHSAAPSLFRKLAYDPVADFEPLARLYFLPLFLVCRTELVAASAGDLLALSKNGPPLTYAWQHSTARVGGETLRVAGGRIVGVPYRTHTQALIDVMSGVVDFGFVDYVTAQQMATAGRLRILGITATEPSMLAPSVPPIAASVPGFDIVSWAGAFAPAGVTKPVATRLADAFLTVMAVPDVVRHLAAYGCTPAPLGGAAFKDFLLQQLTAWREKIKAADIAPS